MNTRENEWLVTAVPPGRLLVLVVLLLGSTACQSPPAAREAERIFWDSPPTWVPPLPALQVSPDETSAIFGGGRFAHERSPLCSRFWTAI